MTKHFLKTVISINIALCAIVVFFIYFEKFNKIDEFAFLIGSGLAVFNFSLLIFLWKMVFKKKNIALLIITIVSKYASLAFVIGFVVKSENIDKMSFVFGILTNPLAIILSLLVVKLLKSNKSRI